MATNTTPIFGGTPRNSYLACSVTANTAMDGTGTVTTVFTAGANGSKVDQMSFWHLGTNVASVLRVFINNGSANSVATNNALEQEVTMAANTVSQVAASIPVVIYPSFILPAGYKINVVTGTTVASGHMVSCQGSDY